MVKDFGCDLLVAKYALITVDYSSVDDACDIIFGSGSPESGPLQHPYFAYTPESYEAVELDTEANANLDRCFLCDKAESFHKEDSDRKHLDTDEAHMLNQWGTSI